MVFSLKNSRGPLLTRPSAPEQRAGLPWCLGLRDVAGCLLSPRVESWWEAPGAVSSRPRGLPPEGSPWGRGPHALDPLGPWPGPRRRPNRGGWGEVQQGYSLPGPGTARGTRPRASAASAVPGAGVPLCFLKTGTSLPGCIGFSEDSLGLQHVGASERCPGLAPRPRSRNFPRGSPAPVFRMSDPEVRIRSPTSPHCSGAK